MFKEKNSRNQDSDGSNLAPFNAPRKLSVREVALGLGRKATDDELNEYLNRPHGAAIPLDKAVEIIKSKLQKKRQQRKKWK